MYRISFTYVAGSDSKIHVIRKLGELPTCGAIPMAYHPIFNFEEVRRSTFCVKCLHFYIERDEKEFAVIK